MRIELKGIEETDTFGKRLGELVEAGDVICLNGDLGAGKTTISKSVGLGLGVEDYITSPTFTIINEYQGRLPLYHFDVYRLNDGEDLYDLGVEDYFYGKGVCLIEWAENIQEYLPDDRLELWIYRTENPDERIVELKAFGNRSEFLAKELIK
ncbi:tRNA (adenosine(37)-N6)-threonylcarbamoyltransferase complex ATPase subunit type 1 TsaE [Gudongella sp. SC589]|jgi:tRNA threonylcarbamoyladenosine biosynthesis protein TsaE|uniref:tRNA (adenosine(37)-N6)-threonylcarbamoyltransferase complex ATPase subunit type 1 TsaE n=1 Tax=Gudongella sp. SC589 TaxID=3385990 RepID=UPI0039048CB1